MGNVGEESSAHLSKKRENVSANFFFLKSAEKLFFFFYLKGRKKDLFFPTHSQGCL